MNAFSNSQFCYASLLWTFAGETSISKIQKIYYRTLHIVHETYTEIIWRSYEKTLTENLMNDDISIHQNHLHFLATEIFKSVNDLNLQFMWNYFRFKPILYELRKGNVIHFSPAGSAWHGINYFLFCRSLLGNTLPRKVKESSPTVVFKSKLKETFFAPVLCVDKYQGRIKNPVGFNSFKPLTISARSYFLEAWLVSDYTPNIGNYPEPRFV